MATSGVSTWSLNRDSIINSALRKLGVLAEGNSATAAQLLTGAEALNSLLKVFQTKGMPVWAIKEYTFSTVAGTSTYNIGNSQTINTPMPLKVIQGYRIESTGAVNVPLQVFNHYDYNLLSVNAANGEPVSLYYQPLATYGVLKLWPTPIDATTTITIVYQRPFEDMVAGTDDIDFPSYWTDAIVYNLAWRLAPEYGTSKEDRANIKSEAREFTEMAEDFDVEEGSLYIMPDWTGRK
jgi:hypothetical protein